MSEGQRKRGRPPGTGKGRNEPVLVRLSAKHLAMLDAWREAQGGRPSRPEALRRLMLAGLEKAPFIWEGEVIGSIIARGLSASKPKT